MSAHESNSAFQISIRAAKRFGILIVLFLFAAWLASGVFTVGQNELGLVEYFGAAQKHALQPGIHYALPAPFARVHIIPVLEMKRATISYSGKDTSAQAFIKDGGLGAYCISGDNNILNIEFVIQYRIVDPFQYTFNAMDHDNILEHVAGRALIRTIAHLPVDDVLTFGKQQIETQIQHRINDQVDELGCGIEVSFIELVDVSPPRLVQYYFDDVINAHIDKERLINEAESYRNTILLEARGNSQRMVQEAVSYKARVTTEAQGESQRFLKQQEAFSQAPTANQYQQWQEIITGLFPQFERVVIMNTDQGTPAATLRLPVRNEW